MTLNLKNTVVTEREKPVEVNKDYPWIGTWNGLVVLFTEPRMGVCLAGDPCNKGFCGTFSEPKYKPFFGALTMVFEKEE